MRALFGMNLRRRGLQACGSRFAGLLVALLLGLFMQPGGAMAQPTTEARAAMPDEPVQTEVRDVLSQYGRFVQHARYGEVWVPTVTPQDWHPYPPCNWVKTQAIRLVLRRQDAVGPDRASLRPLVLRSADRLGLGSRF